MSPIRSRSGLPQGLRRAVELAFVEIIPADHGFDFARLRFDREESALDFRLLFQSYFNLLFRSIHIGWRPFFSEVRFLL